jgi:hypothetical protein
MIITAGPAKRVAQYHGRCQCGAVRYRVEIETSFDAAACGLSVWECIVKPGGFELLAGDDQLSGHQFAARSAHHFFCESCGVRSFSRHAESPCGEFYTVDLRCLEPGRRASA